MFSWTHSRGPKHQPEAFLVFRPPFRCCRAQERKKMPAKREEDTGVPEESSTSICKMASFYRKYRIEFHISGMVFCLIGGKVK